MKKYSLLILLFSLGFSFITECSFSPKQIKAQNRAIRFMIENGKLDRRSGTEQIASNKQVLENTKRRK